MQSPRSANCPKWSPAKVSQCQAQNIVTTNLQLGWLGRWFAVLYLVSEFANIFDDTGLGCCSGLSCLQSFSWNCHRLILSLTAEAEPNLSTQHHEWWLIKMLWSITTSPWLCRVVRPCPCEMQSLHVAPRSPYPFALSVNIAYATHVKIKSGVSRW